MGGGGINIAVSGYIAFGALKYSSDENTRELYGLLSRILEASSGEEFKDATQAYRVWKKQNRNGAKIIAKGVYKMTRGFRRMFNPLATQAGQVYGFFTFVHGGVLAFYGEVLLLIEWSGNNETE